MQGQPLWRALLSFLSLAIKQRFSINLSSFMPSFWKMAKILILILEVIENEILAYNIIYVEFKVRKQPLVAKMYTVQYPA